MESRIETICIPLGQPAKLWEIFVLARMPALALAVFLAGGCRSYESWQHVNEDAPFAAPLIRAKSVQRWSEPPRFIIAVGGYDHRWIEPGGKWMRPYEARRAAEKYLIDSGATDQWPETDSSIGSVNLRLAPYRFTIVSIFPTVVLMEPHRYPERKGRSTNEVLAPRPTQSVSSFSGLILMNDFAYGTSGSYFPGMLWFSPDLKCGPVLLNMSGPGSGQVSLRDGAIEITIEGTVWHAKRVGPPK